MLTLGGGITCQSTTGTCEAFGVQLAEVPIPMTPTARAAYDVVSRFSAPALVNHCVRSYLFAASRAALDGLSIDHEVLYVASLLHDLGLEDVFDSHLVSFEEAGGSIAWVFAAGAGWPPSRCDHTAAVIVAHMRGTDPAVDPEGHLLDLATGLDISGRGREHWPLELQREIVARYPRLDLASRFTACIIDQAVRKPQSQAAAAVERGLVAGLANNPLDRLGSPG
jgi:hypothetical protein